MNQRKAWLSAFWVLILLAGTPGVQSAAAQTCTMGPDLDPPVRAAIENAAHQNFQLASQGNTASLQQVAAPEFQGIASVVSGNPAAFSGTPMIHLTYLLDNSQQPSNKAFSGPPQQQGDARVEFYCGIFNSPDRVGFVFPSLPQGRYAVVVQDVDNAKPPYLVSWILHEIGGQWKVAGLITRPKIVAGHDGKWYWQQARNYRQKGQIRNAYLYYGMADQILRPFDAMSTPGLDKLLDEWQGAVPPDFPVNGPIDLTAGPNTYRVTQIFALPVGEVLDVIVKYQVPDVSDSAKAYQDNMNVIKALVAKYPELREAFNGVVARAVAPSGQDYGTLLAMKDVK
ncbi:MAG TPA: hypothetical protein VD837_14265 [Terriglobales bacterium]|nr:hypothetical protein [Terriglobales bacterium]